MRQLLKDGHVVDDNWILAEDNLESLPSSGNVLLSTSQWQQLASELDQQQARVGVWLEGNEEILTLLSHFCNYQ